LAGQMRNRQIQLQRLRNSYWFGHEALGSSARVVHGRIYEVPAAIGPVDVAFFGSILLHLRDPLLALANGARFARETVVVTDLFHNPWALYLPALPGGGKRPLWVRARLKLARWLLGALRKVPPPADSLPQVVL